MTYVYELYCYYFEELIISKIFSPKELSIKELMNLIEKAIKVVGESESHDPTKICRKINEWLGTKPTRKNITEIIEVRYQFANSCNCGGYFKNEKIYDWLRDSNDYKSRRFFTWWDSIDDIRYYSPVRFGLDIYKDE